MNTELSITTPAALSIFDSSRFELAWKQAEVLAKSDLVPKAFQGKAENCLIALELADRMNASAFMVMQNVDIIHGKPGFRALFLIGCFNACGRFSPIQYRVEKTGAEKTVEVELEKWEGYGNSRSKKVVKTSFTYTPTTCVAFATDLKSGVVVEGPPVSYDLALQEGWVSKDGSKWLTEMRELMLRYRAAAFMIRTTAPEISLGIPTSDEIADSGNAPEPETRDVTPKSKFAREAAEKTVEAPTVEVIAPVSVQDELKARLESSGITVKEALHALHFIGIGDGKTSFSKMDDETLGKILKSWDVLADEVSARRVTEGGAK